MVDRKDDAGSSCNFTSSAVNIPTVSYGDGAARPGYSTAIEWEAGLRAIMGYQQFLTSIPSI